MKKKTGITLTLLTTLLVSASAVQAGDAVVGAIFGGGAGALIGQQIGGRNGAIAGGALGAAAGVAIATDHRRQRVDYVPAPVYVRPYHPVYYAPPVIAVPQRVVYVHSYPRWDKHYGHGWKNRYRGDEDRERHGHGRGHGREHDRHDRD